MKNKFCIYILFLLLGCMACNFSTTQEKYKTLGSETWERDSNYKFEFNITQPGSYHVSTCIRHSTDYKQRNISCYLIKVEPIAREVARRQGFDGIRWMKMTNSPA